MQEEVESKMVTLSVNTTKLTARTLKQALEKFLAHQRNKAAQHNQNKDVIPHGKQTVKQLAAQNQGLTNIEITDKNSEILFAPEFEDKEEAPIVIQKKVEVEETDDEADDLDVAGLFDNLFDDADEADAEDVVSDEE